MDKTNVRREFHESTTVLSTGTAMVLGHDVPAVLVRNLYRQEIVWGNFSTQRGKFKGKESNSGATEGVRYVSCDGHEVGWNPPFGDYE